MAAGTLAVAVAACENTPVALPEATNLIVPVTELTLIAGEDAGLTAQVVDQDGRVLPDAQVSWTSSAPSVAIVFQDDGGGFVEAVSPGTATLTATYGSLTATVAVTVTQETRETVQSVTFMSESGSYGIDEGPVDLRVVAFDGFGEELSCFAIDDRPFTVTSSDESVATASLIGCEVQLSLLAAGQATITLTVDGASDTYELTVAADDDFAFFINGLPDEAAAGETVSIGVKAVSETGAPLEGQTINFDVEIGSLSATGVETDEDGIATVEWTIPTVLRDFGLATYEIEFSAELPSGNTTSDDFNLEVTTDAATSLKLFHRVQAGTPSEYVEITDDAVTYETGAEEFILVASYDQYGNLVETDNAVFVTAPNDVTDTTGDDTLIDGELDSLSPYVELESATEQTVTLTVEVTTAEGEVLETDLEVEFVAPTP